MASHLALIRTTRSGHCACSREHLSSSVDTNRYFGADFGTAGRGALPRTAVPSQAGSSGSCWPGARLTRGQPGPTIGLGAQQLAPPPSGGAGVVFPGTAPRRWACSCWRRADDLTTRPWGTGQLGLSAARPSKRERRAGGSPASDHDAFDLVDGHRVRRPVVELRRLRRRVPRDLLGVLKRPPVRQVRRDPRRPETCGSTSKAGAPRPPPAA